MMSGDTVRIAVIALVAVILAKMLLPKVPGGAAVAAYL
jgi:hypothetical protein